VYVRDALAVVWSDCCGCDCCGFWWSSVEAVAAVDSFGGPDGLGIVDSYFSLSCVASGADWSAVRERVYLAFGVDWQRNEKTIDQESNQCTSAHGLSPCTGEK